MTSVLVVDDEFDIAEVVRLVLEERGYEVFSASDGAEAQALLKEETREAPALIITDVMMPHMSGFELVDWCRTQEKLAKIPIIVMSAVRPAKTDGPWQAFLQKPFTLHKLVAALESVLGG